MPAPDRLLNTLRRAIAFVDSTPGRSGHLVRLPPDTVDVLVAGDLHGHVETFRTIFQRADLANHPGRHLILQELIHGPFDYPDGSDKSHQLVDLFAALKCQFPARVHYLPGNHELAQWTGRPVGKSDQPLNERFRLGVTTAYGTSGADVYRLYLDLFQACPYGIRTPNAVFVSHSIPAARFLGAFDASRLEAEEFAETDFQPGGLIYSLLWGRDTAEQTVDDFTRKVDADWFITGHIPTEQGYLVPNHRQLIVDCAHNPSAFVLFPTDRTLTFPELVECVQVIE